MVQMCNMIKLDPMTFDGHPVTLQFKCCPVYCSDFILNGEKDVTVKMWNARKARLYDIRSFCDL